MVTNPFGHLGGLNRLLGDTARRRSAALVVSTLVGLLYFAGCSNWTTASSGAASAKDAKVADAPGRFVFLQARLTGSAGDERSVVLRLDSATGETWILEAATMKWVSLKDNLQPIGVFDPDTKKVKWEVKLPDGRYVNDLSKDELVRYVSGMVQQPGNAGAESPKK